jgi:hypothetical protein
MVKRCEGLILFSSALKGFLYANSFYTVKEFLNYGSSPPSCVWCCVDLNTYGVLMECVYVCCVYASTCIIVLCPCIYTLCTIITLTVNNFVPIPYDLLFVLSFIIFIDLLPMMIVTLYHM